MKEEITRQSVLLFEQKGFSETSIQDIADALGVTKGTFYYYFSSKEQLLMEIHDDYITNLVRRQERITQDPSLSERDKITGIIHLLITDIDDKGPSARVYSREMLHLGKEHAKSIRQKRETFRLNIEAVLREGIEQGEFDRRMHADMIAFGILGVTNWSYNWFNPHGEVSPVALAEMFAGMILNGIGLAD
ncbi:TetR/AcrR family transcriptional regulator [Lentibacillus sediminis]|uniref:TetR/AcrR family transcriptional regulator n=1 Tax=Lentibacillus sediminis TaxID=1940529 RepID=UPI000C1C2E1A|nr:TetR/AcrR family transcriptional regulator [Lentibacillus sediminis]